MQIIRRGAYSYRGKWIAKVRSRWVVDWFYWGTDDTAMILIRKLASCCWSDLGWLLARVMMGCSTMRKRGPVSCLQHNVMSTQWLNLLLLSAQDVILGHSFCPRSEPDYSILFVLFWLLSVCWWQQHEVSFVFRSDKLSADVKNYDLVIAVLHSIHSILDRALALLRCR